MIVCETKRPAHDLDLDDICRMAEGIRDNRKEITDLELETSDIENYLRNYDRSSTLLDLADSLDLSGDSYDRTRFEPTSA